MGVLDVFFQSYSASLLVALAVLLLVYYISSSNFSSGNLGKDPPGPRPLPVIGNLLQIDLNRLYHTLLEFSKKYGSVFTVYLGPQKMVVLAGYKTVKEALVKHDEEFGDRDILQILRDINKGHGVLWSNGDSWREMRRFALTNLRDFGMGKKVCEDKIIEECQHLIEVFKKFRGEPFDTLQPTNYAVSNIICSMVYGSRFEYNDPEFTSMVDRTNRVIQLSGSPTLQLYNMFPRLFKWIKSRKEFLGFVAGNHKQNLALFSRLKETLNPEMCRGLVDAFLVRKQSLQESGNKNSHFHNDNLLITVSNLFNAGTETTSTTLRWGFLLMAKYPKIQDQVQEELKRVIGDRQVQVADRKGLPFTDAVIHETQRLASIVPTALPHKTSKDIMFQGYFIKKGTTVCPLLTSVLHDPSEWQKPHSFHPAHFLDKDGKFVKRDAFLPFSAGRRICLGESLARMELFIFFTTLLQHFRFTPAPGVREDELDLTPCGGITLSPLPHKLCAVSRIRVIYDMNAASQKQKSALFTLKETLNPQICRGLVDAFLVQKQKLKEAGVTINEFHDDNLFITVSNLFAAGTETTSTTLRWGLLFMAKFPQIQDKVQEELRVIGDRQVQVADRKNLPYTDAIIHETQRMANIVPTSLPHKTTRDITFQGHFIKKGTTVYPLLMSVLYDENEWEKPHSFYPPHFLDEDGKFIKRNAFIPFSAGRRICLGEGLARMELFIFFSTLLQHFRFTPAPGISVDDLDLTPQTGLTLTPLPHNLCAVSCM
ncbi:LOW QUALITY PROTEIN: cytochrome P450 2K1-like [Anableps anableps]